MIANQKLQPSRKQSKISAGIFGVIRCSMVWAEVFSGRSLVLVLWSSARGKKEDLKPELMCCWTQELLRSGDMGVLEKHVIRAVCEGSMRDLLGAELSLCGDNFQDRRRTWM